MCSRNKWSNTNLGILLTSFNSSIELNLVFILQGKKHPVQPRQKWKREASPTDFQITLKNSVMLSGFCFITICYKNLTSVKFCLDFEFGWRVHFALRHKMLKPLTALFPAIYLDGRTCCTYEAIVKRPSARPWIILGQTWMMKTATQAYFYFFLNALLSAE